MKVNGGGDSPSFFSEDIHHRECGDGKGEKDTPFGNKGWVLVRKGGASQVIKAKYSKYSVVFNHQGIPLSMGD